MPDLCDVSYSHDATVRAFMDYYQFLVDMCMDEAQIIHPQAGGWPSISLKFRQGVEKSDEVISLLSDLPYIRSDGTPTHGSAHCYWADWKFISSDWMEDTERGPESVMSLRSATEDWHFENVPTYVVLIVSKIYS